MKIGDKVEVSDRGLKIHTFVGTIVAIDKTIEGTKLFSVDLQLRDKDDKPNGKKLIALQEYQISPHIEEKKEQPKKEKKNLEELKELAKTLEGEKDGKDKSGAGKGNKSSEGRSKKPSKSKQGTGNRSGKKTKKSSGVSRQSVRDSKDEDGGQSVPSSDSGI